jgi:hypothetical protein
MKNTKTTLVLILTVFAASCASNPNKAKEIDTAMEEKGQYQGSKIGMNEDKEVVVQTEKAVDQELREESWKAADLEAKLKSDHDLLTRCRDEVADPRLGGSGTVTEIPEIDNMKPTNEVREEMGITPSGELKFVKKEMFMERLQSVRKYKDHLESMIKLVKKSRADCEREMGAARVKAGLPAKRYQAKGFFKEGQYIKTRDAEHSLDDAFEIKAKESKQ